MDQQPTSPDRRNPWLVLAAVWLVAITLGAMILLAVHYTLQRYLAAEAEPHPTTQPASKSAETPQLRSEVVISGLHHPWDIAFLPDGQLLFTERSGTLSKLTGTTKVPVADISDVRGVGEGGLMGLAIDPKFTENRFIYTCYNSTSTPIDIRVVRWRVNAGTTGLEARADIITGMPSNTSGRHSGCRMAFGPDGYLWIGTGDTAQNGRHPQTPQDPKSLGGKILRVDREGKAAPGNMEAPFDSRIYSYGHRNIQGIAFLAQSMNGVIGFSAEHGSTVDDEVNELKKGNFGWDPDVPYTELNVPMTDKQKYPDAIEATWRSGSPTQAPSGLATIRGPQWKVWDGALAMAMLKDKHLKILLLDNRGKITKEERALDDKGRLRDIEQSPDGNLYISTDNGKNEDQIVRLVPY